MLGRMEREPRPGEPYVMRRMPTASVEEREAAYQRLRGLIRLLIEIDSRLAQEKSGKPGDSPESAP